MRIPSLDGLRAISISLVIFGHLPFAMAHVPHVSSVYAHAGVLTFFVISGFLITSLMQKDRDRGRFSPWAFYQRRMLRIFPAFYFYFLPVFLLGRYSAKEGMISGFYLASYATYFYHPSWNFYHLWSLSVEEQFYLIWPILFVMGWHKWAAWGMVIISPLVRFWLNRAGGYAPGADFYFPAVADAIAVGCLLAIYRDSLPERLGRFLVVPVAVVPLLGRFLHSNTPALQIVGHLRWSLFSFGIAAVIIWAIEAKPVILNNKLAVWVGMLSYSLYLWQMPFMNPAWHLPTAYRLTAMLALACASYYLVELPALRLRSQKHEAPGLLRGL
jgi:peptidoglycan/LPS O-acetylase OafA/YrhL